MWMDIPSLCLFKQSLASFQYLEWQFRQNSTKTQHKQNTTPTLPTNANSHSLSVVISLL